MHLKISSKHKQCCKLDIVCYFFIFIKIIDKLNPKSNEKCHSTFKWKNFWLITAENHGILYL